MSCNEKVQALLRLSGHRRPNTPEDIAAAFAAKPSQEDINYALWSMSTGYGLAQLMPKVLALMLAAGADINYKPADRPNAKTTIRQLFESDERWACAYLRVIWSLEIDVQMQDLTLHLRMLREARILYELPTL